MDVLTHHRFRRWVTRALRLGLCAKLLVACEAPSAPESLFESQEMSAEMVNNSGTDESDVDADRELEYLSTVEGAWVHYSQVSTCVDIGSSLEQYNRSLYTVRVTEREHGALLERWEACEIDLTPVISVRARVPEALRSSVYPLETKGGLIVGQAPSQRYQSAPIVELWGVEMEQALIESMPDSAEDERIYDMDEDDRVGVTLEIGDACLAYMAQRRITTYQGTFTAPDTIEGEALSVTEQFIIDASAPICKTSYQTRSNPARSHFERIRVDGRGGSINLDLDGDGDVSCEELSVGRDLLFIERLEITDLDNMSCQR